MVGPNVNYVFIPFLILFFIYTAFYFYKNPRVLLGSGMLKFQYPFLIISIFFVLGFLFSSHFIFFAFKEILNILIFLFLNISLFLYINNEPSLNLFTRIYCKQLIYLSLIVSLLGLSKLLIQFADPNLFNGIFAGLTPNTSLNTDYNYYILFSFMGLVALLFMKSSYSRIFFITSFIVLNLNIIFSGSRRGIVLIVLIWISIYFLGSDFKFEFKKVTKRLAVLSIAFLITGICALFLIDRFQVRETKKSVDINPELLNKVTGIIEELGLRYLSIFKIEESITFYNERWLIQNNFNSFRNFKKIGRNRNEGNLIYNGNFKHGLLFWEPKALSTTNEIIDTPFGKGVRVSRLNGDGAGWSLLYTGRGIIFHSDHEYVMNLKFKVIQGKGIPFNIGYWSDFWFGMIGSGASLELNVEDLKDGWKQAKARYVFPKSRSGIPFFLHSMQDSSIVDISDIELYRSENDGKLAAYSDEVSNKTMGVNKYLITYDSLADARSNPQGSNLFGNGNFRQGLKYWLPYADSTQHAIVETPFGYGIRVSRTNGDGAYFSLRYDGRPIIYHAFHTYLIKFNYKIIQGDSLPFNVGWWVNDANQGFRSYMLPLKITKLEHGWKEAQCSYTFKKTNFGLISFLNSLNDNSIVDISNVELIDLNKDDALPVFVDQIKDISKFNSQMVSDSIELRKYSSFISPRINRWKYSIVVFKDSLNFRQKIFGGGFDYLESLGTTFGEVKYDDPHNPFITAFLYSGIIGGLVYLWFMCLVFYNYIRYYKNHIFFFFCFIIVFAFSFFSANTHFSVPIYAVLSIIPFLTKYIIENEKNNGVYNKDES